LGNKDEEDDKPIEKTAGQIAEDIQKEDEPKVIQVPDKKPEVAKN
jgi:hypothetical protein